MNHHCGERLMVTHSCRFVQTTYCRKCRKVKHQYKRLPGGNRTLPRELYLQTVGAVYRANHPDGMTLREAMNIVEAAYPVCHPREERRAYLAKLREARGY